MNQYFTGVRAAWFPLYAHLLKQTKERVGEFEEHFVTSGIVWRHNAAFTDIRARKDALIVSFVSDQLHDEWAPQKAVQTSKRRVSHTFDVTEEAQLPALVDRIAAAYALTWTDKPRKVASDAKSLETIDAYIAQYEGDTAALLRRVRDVIREAAPDAKERMSWQMPTFWQGENLVHFALQKQHLGFYPGGEATGAFADRLAQYKTSKGTIRFPLSEPIPYELIAEITRWRVSQVDAKA